MVARRAGLGETGVAVVHHRPMASPHHHRHRRRGRRCRRPLVGADLAAGRGASPSPPSGATSGSTWPPPTWLGCCTPPDATTSRSPSVPPGRSGRHPTSRAPDFIHGADGLGNTNRPPAPFGSIRRAGRRPAGPPRRRAARRADAGHPRAAVDHRRRSSTPTPTGLAQVGRLDRDGWGRRQPRQRAARGRGQRRPRPVRRRRPWSPRPGPSRRCSSGSTSPTRRRCPRPSGPRSTPARRPAAEFLAEPLAFYRTFGSTLTPSGESPCHDLRRGHGRGAPVVDGPVLPLAVQTAPGPALGATIADRRQPFFARAGEGSEQDLPEGFASWQVGSRRRRPAVPHRGARAVRRLR